MNKYERVPDTIIDLHRYTTGEAATVLDSILDGNNAMHLRIITGKGTHGSNGPVLRTFVKEFLTRNRIRFTQSKISDGGEGALEVFVGE